MKITPSIGRVVLVRLAGVNMGTTPADQPFPALISYVFSDTAINVGGFDAQGLPFSRRHIQLIPADAPLPEASDEDYAHWMPWQIASAARAETLEVAVNDEVATPTAPAIDPTVPPKN